MSLPRRSSQAILWAVTKRAENLVAVANTVPGHVFVIHGKLEDVTCDAALIPTDTRFTVEKQWWKVVGSKKHPQRPARWSDFGYGQDTKNGHLWYVDVTDGNDPTSGGPLFERVSKAIKQIATKLRRRSAIRGRARHLITMPLLGAGGGGLGSDRSVRLLLDGLQEIADANRFDLAIVVLERAKFEALQRRRQRVSRRRGVQHRMKAEQLGELVQRQGLSLMIGAGVSMGAGLPDWSGLLRELVKEVPDRDRKSVV